MAALVAVVGGFALGLAPLLQNKVDVTWPQDAQDIESTALLLINQTPHVLEAQFGAEAVESAADNGGVVLSTVRPDRADAVAEGLLVDVANGELRFALGDDTFTSGDLDATWAISSSIAGFRIERDGAVAQEWPDALPPQIDALITDATSVPSSEEFRVHVQVVDDNATTPTVLKILLIAIVVLALAAVAYLLWRDDRARPGYKGKKDREPRRPPPWWSWVSIAVIDLLVVVSLVVWTFIGSMTADDGYYALMARNSEAAGFVGMYYQVFNQTFVPFVWYWQFFEWWQSLGGYGTVWLRIPSLVFGIAAWALIRVFIRRFVPTGPVRGIVLLGLTGLAFVCWWCTYSIGVRAESVAAMLAIGVVLLVVTAVKDRILLPAFVAAAAATLAFAAHPVGIVAFGPLLVAVVPLWTVVRDGVGSLHAAARFAGVVSGGAVGLIAAFGDGSIGEALDGQRRFSAVEPPRTWMDEILRYILLFEQGPQGTYAKRVVVLVALTLIVWFIAAWVWDRARPQRRIDASASILGWGFAVGFILIWITTSKWTHHFGAMAALGSLFIGYMVVALPIVIAPMLTSARARWTVAALGTASLLPALIVSLNGPQQWFSWNPQLPQSGESPSLAGVPLTSMRVWVVIVVVAVIIAILIARRRRDAADPFVMTAVVSMAGFTLVVGYMFGTFGVAAIRGLDDYSSSAGSIRDPWGTSCEIERAIRTWDATQGVAMDGETPEALPEPDEALPDGTPTDVVTATGAQIWSSAAADGEVVTGEFTSGWYEMPALAEGQRVVVAVGGHLTNDPATDLDVEAISGGELVATGIADRVDRAGWRTLDISEALVDAERFRIVVRSATTVPGEWISVSTPIISDERSFLDVFPEGTPVSTHWHMSFWFTCTTPPTIANGIVEPPAGATTWGDVAYDMNPWTPARGGLLAGAARLANIATLDGEMVGLGTGWGRVQTFSYPLAENAYDLDVTKVTRPGWRSSFPPPSQLVERDRAESGG